MRLRSGNACSSGQRRRKNLDTHHFGISLGNLDADQFCAIICAVFCAQFCTQ
jgi:hypothetical protein